MGTIPALLLACVCLQLGLLVRDGFYHGLALLLLIVSLASVTAAFVWALLKSPLDAKPARNGWFVAATLVVLLSNLFKPPGMYVHTPAFDLAYRSWIVLAAIAAAAVYLRVIREPRIRKTVFITLVAAALAFRVWMPIASPSPVIDVFAVGQEGSRNLLQGRNPFATPITDVYGGQGPRIAGYTYLPGDLYLQAVAYAPLGDVRFACVLAEVVIAAVLWDVSKRRWPTAIAEMIVLLLLYAPRSLFVIEQAWVDPLILMCFVLFLWLRDRKKPNLAAAVYGYMLFMKQYLLFAFVQWLIVERDWKRILTGLAAGSAALLPFAILDASAFVRNGLVYNLTIPFRPDALTVFGLLYRGFGVQPPLAWTAFVGLALTVLTFLPQRRIQALRGYLFAVTLTTFGMFLFGSGGFANWYYLVAGQLIFLFAMGARDDPGTNGEASAWEPSREAATDSARSGRKRLRAGRS